ncbi:MULTISPECIES: sigma-54-dependent transcriptional regulator [Alteromonadaceae]|uniref:sigma-54-dependent transcriptional regulator n=1 Tax=Alteromonadaceae TaxID=72275 RepID=UPI001C08AC4A|nr:MULTISPECIES: sigma-54 dependent transcriptional regulator [unclassified Aliiglaciecola]MBU2877096.1 sigma-54 dependent transcriptional regulator [Aliiglaciecola lipolytica]MDO6710185.1 sigma-54 dependent transcriptional regulator [Aliiglaciecola sp. 2_MG-2023]MDO6751333.1 sigma-54 dependent transcriptional regulator [Aliiglaciecola sp. 1_MG-2023]
MLKVLLVDDDSEFTDVAYQIIEFLGHEVSVAGSLKEARQWLEHQHFDHILLDFMLPDGSGLHLIDELNLNSTKQTFITLITGHPSVKGMLAGLCGPNVNYLVKPLQREDIEQVLNRKTKKTAKKQNNSLHFGCLIGESAIMKELYLMIERVAKTNANVMLMGESGVGKEVVAQAIHSASDCEGPLVATNCGALSKELIGSELFGHEKGAFTGAVGRKEGVFERAENGTLFLDEVTEMPIDMQPNLLRVLESKRVTRLGGTKEIDVNCRVVSATNRNISELAESKVLREDIYFRLAVFPIDIPTLRERKEDIPLLAQAFLEELNAENGTSFAWNEAQLKRLSEYDWPGNVRELRHAVHRAFIMSDPESSNIDLPSSFASPFASNKKASNQISAGQTIENVEKELIRATLEKVNGSKTLAAEMLGISTKTLYNRLHAYGDFEE